MKEFSNTLFAWIGWMTFVAVLTKQQVLLIIFVWILIILAAARFWQFYALRRLSYDRVLEQSHVFPDTPVLMHTQIRNRKLLPLSRADIFDVFPAKLEVRDIELQASGRPGKKSLVRSLSLGWYEALNQSYELLPSQRGLYRWGPVDVRTGDPFGLFLSEGSLQSKGQLIVYPRLITQTHLPPEVRRMFGYSSTNHSLHTDPVQTIGIREYQAGDPFKAIHWPATARHGTFQVRIAQPTSALNWMCLLDINTFPHVWVGVNPQRAEWLISLTATVCTQLLIQQHNVGFATNASSPLGNTHYLPPTKHPSQSRRILEYLAQISHYAGTDMDQLVLRLERVLGKGTSLVIISALIQPELVAVVSRLARSGFPIVWIHATPEKPPLSRITTMYAPEVV